MVKNILVIDDSATMRLSLRASLEMNGFKVDTADNGVQAIAKLKNGASPPDLQCR